VTGTQALLLAGRSDGFVDPPGFLSASTSGGAAPQSVSLNVYSNTFGGADKSTINYSATVGGGGSSPKPWYIAPPSAPTSIWARLTVTAGTSPDSGSAVGSWVSIAGTSAGWTWTRSVAGTTTATVTVELATDSGGSDIVVTQTGISISADAS
jgi:hypothetical protein